LIAVDDHVSEQKGFVPGEDQKGQNHHQRVQGLQGGQQLRAAGRLHQGEVRFPQWEPQQDGVPARDMYPITIHNISNIIDFEIPGATDTNHVWRLFVRHGWLPLKLPSIL